MKKITAKKVIIPSIIAVIVVAAISWVIYVRYINQPTRVIDSMLMARVNFEKKPTVAKKYFEDNYLKAINFKQSAIKTPAHHLTSSSKDDQDIVILSFSQVKGAESAGQSDVVKFYLTRYGLYPWLYWSKISKVELLDIRYASTFANILPEVKKTQARFGEKFTISPRFDISLENFKNLDSAAIGDQINKYSFDIKYQTKPLDFQALSLAVSLLGENDMVCVKSQKAEISDIIKDSQTIQFTVFGDFCAPKSIQIDGVKIDSINVSLK